MMPVPICVQVRIYGLYMWHACFVYILQCVICRLRTSDMWSIGVMTAYMATNKVPFDENNERQHLKCIVHTCGE